MHDAGRQPIAIGHLSDSGDLKTQQMADFTDGEGFDRVHIILV